MNKSVTLFKNTQSAGETPADVFSGQWQLAPYTAPSMFHEGITEQTAEFIIPPNVYLVNVKGHDTFIKGQNQRCELFTSDEGRPYLVCQEQQQHPGVDTDSPPLFLYQADETPLADSPPAPAAPSLIRWIPGEDENGELEIF